MTETIAQQTGTAKSCCLVCGIFGRCAHTIGKEPEVRFTWYQYIATVVVQGLAWIVARVLLLMFTRVDVHGREHLKALPAGVIFAANHMNDIDSVVARTALPLFSRFGPFFAVARQYSDYRWKGWKSFIYKDLFFRLMGAYPALRGTHDYEQSLKYIVRIARAKKNILIFTGGQQDTPTEPVKVRGGTGYLSWASGNPIVPVAIEGTFGFGPQRFLKRPHIIVSFGTPHTKEALFGGHEATVETCRGAAAIVVDEIERMRNDARRQLSADAVDHELHVHAVRHSEI